MKCYNIHLPWKEELLAMLDQGLSEDIGDAAQQYSMLDSCGCCSSEQIA